MITNFNHWQDHRIVKVNLKEVTEKFTEEEAAEEVDSYMSNLLMGEQIKYYCHTCDKFHTGVVTATDFEIVDGDNSGGKMEYVFADKIGLSWMKEDDEYEHQVSYNYPIEINKINKVASKFGM